MGNFLGSLVAIDPRNGEVIAMVSEPGFDPQAFVDGIDNKTYHALLNDPKQPLFNRSLQGLYPPGRSEEHTSELQSLMRISYAVFCLNNKIHTNKQQSPNQPL